MDLHIGSELFTRPFLPHPFLTPPTRKGLGNQTTPGVQSHVPAPQISLTNTPYLPACAQCVTGRYGYLDRTILTKYTFLGEDSDGKSPSFLQHLPQVLPGGAYGVPFVPKWSQKICTLDCLPFSKSSLQFTKSSLLFTKSSLQFNQIVATMY